MFIANTKKILSKLSITDYQLILLTIFFLIYSFFSSNVPKVLDIKHYILLLISIVIGCLYIYDTRNLGVKNFFYINFFPFLILIFLIYGFILGFLFKNTNQNIIRDMVSVSSILSIFLIIHLRNLNQKFLNYLVKVLVLCGLIFSIKVIIFYNFFFEYNNYPHGNPIQVAKYYFLYLENTITLALVFFILKIYEHTYKRKFINVIKYSFLSTLPLYVTDIYGLRGPIVSIFLIFLIFLCIRKKSINGLIFSLFFLISSFFSFFTLVLYPLFYFFTNFEKKNIYLFLSFIFLLFIFDHIFLWSSELSNLTHQNILNDPKIKKSSINFFNNRQYEFTMSNKLGTYILYSLDLDIPFSLVGEEPLYFNHSNDKNKPKHYKVTDYEYGRQITKLFYGNNHKINEDQKNFLYLETSNKNLIDSKELRKILLEEFFKSFYTIRGFRCLSKNLIKSSFLQFFR